MAVAATRPAVLMAKGHHTSSLVETETAVSAAAVRKRAAAATTATAAVLMVVGVPRMGASFLQPLLVVV